MALKTKTKKLILSLGAALFVLAVSKKAVYALDCSDLGSDYGCTGSSSCLPECITLADCPGSLVCCDHVCMGTKGGGKSFGVLKHPLPILRDIFTGVALSSLLNNFISLATFGAGILLLVYLVYGGVSYIIAGGDEKQVTKAKQMLTNAIIGLVIVVAAIMITQILGGILGFEDILAPYFLGPGEALPEP